MMQQRRDYASTHHVESGLEDRGAFTWRRAPARPWFLLHNNVGMPCIPVVLWPTVSSVLMAVQV